MGFGAYNMLEGLIDHHLLEVHHVNELIERRYWIYWDVGFLLWGLAMFIIGFWLMRRGQRQFEQTN